MLSECGVCPFEREKKKGGEGGIQRKISHMAASFKALRYPCGAVRKVKEKACSQFWYKD